MARAKGYGSLHQTVSRVRGMYEELTGLSKVLESQEKVEMIKTDLLRWRSDLKTQRQSLRAVQKQIQQARDKLDGISRTDERFLALATKEYELLKQEEESRGKCSQLEQQEREEFMKLYEAVSKSHSQERAYTNRTKYWSVIGSVTGTLIGVIGSSFLNWRRNSQIRDVVRERSDEIKSDTREQFKELESLLDKRDEKTNSKLSDVGKDIEFVRVGMTKQSDCLSRVGGDDELRSHLDTQNFGTSREAFVVGMLLCGAVGVLLTKLGLI